MDLQFSIYRWLAKHLQHHWDSTTDWSANHQVSIDIHAPLLGRPSLKITYWLAELLRHTNTPCTTDQLPPPTSPIFHSPLIGQRSSPLLIFHAPLASQPFPTSFNKSQISQPSLLLSTAHPQCQPHSIAHWSATNNITTGIPCAIDQPPTNSTQISWLVTCIGISCTIDQLSIAHIQ